MITIYKSGSKYMLDKHGERFSKGSFFEHFQIAYFKSRLSGKVIIFKVGLYCELIVGPLLVSIIVFLYTIFINCHESNGCN